MSASKKLLKLSSLHCNTSLSFCLFSYSGLCFGKLKLSVSDVIVNQKRYNGERKLHFLGWDYQRFKILIKMSACIDIDRACDLKRTEGNRLHCTKRAQNKTKIVQWRLLVDLNLNNSLSR